jgi:adenylate cyclase
VGLPICGERRTLIVAVTWLSICPRWSNPGAIRMSGSNASDLAGKLPDRRKLIAVMYADMVGYSRLIGLDDAGTLQRLRTLRREVIDPAIEEHAGHIVQTGGDSLLVVFDSIDGAVRCGVQVQQQVPIHDGDQPSERAIRFRVGINIGDAIADGTDLHGDAVNVVARLQAECPPGGICVSRSVRDHVHGRLELTFEELGSLRLKNIARPVEAFTVKLDGAAVPRIPRPVLLDVSESKSIPVPRLSIVVLPFANLSGDTDQQYFVDGITDDLTADLSRLPDMFVISCNTALTYRSKRVETKQIGRELGVRYVLEGSIRRSGDRVRVNAQLIDATTDSHLWAERFEGDTGDLLALQDEIASRIAVALDLELVDVEAARPTQHPDALDCIFRARAALSKPSSRITYMESISLLEHAVSLDAQSSEAQSRLASVLTGRVLDGLADSPATDIACAEVLVESALAASPRSPIAHYAKGQVLRAQHRNDEAIPEFETAIALNRNWPIAYAQLGRCKFYTGSVEEMIPLIMKAIRLSPRDGEIGQWFFRIGVVHLVQSRIDEAIVWLEKARNAMPAHPLPHAHLASAYALRGDIETAAEELADARRLSADHRYSSVALLQTIGYFGVPKVQALYEATFFTGLRRAGVPEE